MILINKIKHHIVKMRLEPIRVFLFHQVSDSYQEERMWLCDWTNTEIFQQRILDLSSKYVFVSLDEAYKHICHDYVRKKKYAVLTCDDGILSTKDIIPWLAEHNIPTTLFLNPLYFSGQLPRSPKIESFLSEQELIELVRTYSPYVTIASHGWSHCDNVKLTDEDFTECVNKAQDSLEKIGFNLPFYAFPLGRHTERQSAILLNKGLIPVLVDGGMNYNDRTQIHRECIDGNDTFIL